ncbi:MAG TPA: hypothetical protein VHF22_15440, partial [Planctomycetota bacterium]|nr:hypothetical protein [Planctomycetota bacterium]
MAELTPERVAEERRFFLARGGLVRDVAHAALGPALALAVWALAAWIYALPWEVAATPALLLAIPLGWRLT